MKALYWKKPALAYVLPGIACSAIGIALMLWGNWKLVVGYGLYEFGKRLAEEYRKDAS